MSHLSDAVAEGDGLEDVRDLFRVVGVWVGVGVGVRGRGRDKGQGQG